VRAPDDALAVACRQSAPLALGDRAGEPAQVQALEVGAEMDRADIRVAEQPQQFRAREQSLPGAEQTGRLSAGQPSDGRCTCHDADLRTCPALGRQVQPGAVSGMLQDFLQGIVSAADLAAGVALEPLAVHDRVGDGLEQRQGLRMQGAGQMARAVGVSSQLTPTRASSRRRACSASSGLIASARVRSSLASRSGSACNARVQIASRAVAITSAPRPRTPCTTAVQCPAHLTRHEQVPERPQVTVQALGEPDGPARRLDAAPGSALHHRRR